MEEVSKSVEDLSAKMDEMKQLFLQKIETICFRTFVYLQMVYEQIYYINFK